MLTFGCAMALFACDKDDDDDDKDPIPAADVEKAVEYLESWGYEVDYEIGDEGEESYIEAEMDDDRIMIIYCQTTEDADEYYNDLLKELEEEKEEDPEEVARFKVGKDGKVVWVGTKAAIKAASKKGSDGSGNDNDGGLGGGSSPNTVPASDPEEAKATLEDAGYEVRILKGDDLADIAEQFGDGDSLEAVLSGSKDDDYISIYYFADKDSANDYYEEMKEELEELKEAVEEIGEEFNLELGKSGKIVWGGTKDAINAAK